jgi:hypothetical protein
VLEDYVCFVIRAEDCVLYWENWRWIAGDGGDVTIGFDAG